MDRKLFFTLVIALLIGLVGQTLFQIFAPFLSPLIWAGILVTVTYPLYRKLLAYMPKQRELASGLLCLGLTLVVVLPISLLLLVLFKDLQESSEHLTRYLHTVDYQELMQFKGPIFENPIVQQVRTWIDPYVELEKIDLRALAMQGVQRVSQFLINQSRGVLGAFGGFFFLLVMTEICMFFLFRDGPRFVAFVKRLIPIENKELVFQRMREVIQATMFGTLGTAVVQGFIGGVVFLILGLPSAVLWAVVMILSSFLPLLGTSLVWVPAAIWFLIKGSVVKAIIMVAAGVGISTVDNFIRPILIRSVSSKDNQLNTLVLLLAVLGGISVFGFLGIVLGPMLVVLFLTMLELLYAHLGYEIHPLETLQEDQPLPAVETHEVKHDVLPPESGIPHEPPTDDSSR